MGKRDSRLSSRTKIRNLINQNGISYLSGNEEDESYHGATMDILEESVTDGMYVKIGKKATFKVKIDDTEKSS